MTKVRVVDVNLRELAGCTCLKLRRTTRRVTKMYDQLLNPSGLTANQFNLLAQLYWASRRPPRGLTIGMLAQLMGMDPTTVNRNLKPLAAQGLVKDGADPADRRIRMVLISGKGALKLQKAVPLWRQAQTTVQQLLGAETTLALSALLDLSTERLATESSEG